MAYIGDPNPTYPNPSPNPPAMGAPAPPPPRGGRGGRGGGRSDRRNQINFALTALQNALMAGGVKSDKTAMLFARRMLSRPGVAIGQNGKVHYKGTTFNATDFAASRLGQLVTGAIAKKRNEDAIKNDPAYREQEAAMALQRDQLAASLADARRQALIDFGDPTLFQGDPATAAAAEANPFSTRALLAASDAKNRQAVQQGANNAGTLFGGGVQSGMNEAGRVNAAGTADAYNRIRALLSSTDLQNVQAGQQYDLGVRNALIEATQRLLASGVIHAAHAPAWKVGGFSGYRLWHAPRVAAPVGGPHRTPPSSGPAGPGGAPLPPPPLPPAPPPPVRY